ncbi:hypothetical protein [Pseudonocardia sp.]|uniref:hypothetical protein n=1 Tax=Pseudonocardia sp. TaxID=60912 RepID=UPI003D0C307F
MTALAVALAVLGALCFAVAATLQHREVGTVTPAPGVLTAGGLRDLVRRRRWLAGLAFGATGAVLHVLALVLAPLPLVQPLGVLAVPMAVLLAGRTTPPAGVLAGVALTVAGVVGFVALSVDGTAGGGDGGGVPTGFVTDASLAVAVVVVALVGFAHTRSGWVRSLACAAAAATSFGFVSVLLRAASRLLVEDAASPADAAAALGAAALGLLVGGWLLQQAFASGPPEPIVACLTVLDPIVGVGLAMAVLGEGRTDAPGARLAAAAVATAGVLVLARHHPDAAGRRRPPMQPTLRPQRPQRPVRRPR